MRTISADQQRLIDDAIAELSIGLGPAILEKDILVTEALRAISGINLPDLTITFCGGTCLSKAFRLLERMSEDIDLRVSIADQAALTRSALRRKLSDLKQAFVASFQAADFGLTNDAIVARNENHFLAFDLEYTSKYAREVVLRPTVRVEFTANAPRCSAASLSFASLIDELTGRRTTPPVTLACLSIEETYCEKIISYLRRATEHLAGRENSQYEERLARHVYDVHQIATMRKSETEKPGVLGLFKEILTSDAAQYGSRIKGFQTDPVGTMLKTLQTVREHPDFRRHYDRFVADLVYGRRRPTFDEAFSTFEREAAGLLR